MKIRLLVLLIALASGVVHADDRWSGLWRNADQRGEQLLQKGDAATAAKTFTDPRHKAYARLKAGEFADAAKAYSAFDDGDAHYNRGNALAHAGDLMEALKAYETALARDPNNRDAQHNRDLVEQALKQQEQQQQQSSDSQDQDEKNEEAQKQPSDSGENADPKSDQGPDKKEASQPSGDKPLSEIANQSAANAEAKPEGGAPEANQQVSEAKSQDGDDAEAAKRDAQASVEQAARDQPAKPERADANRAGERSAGTDDSVSARPLTEQQLAQEQWLRRIPDDPGGLLRRKFLIEHMLREQQKQQP